MPLRRERLEGLIGVTYTDAEVDRALDAARLRVGRRGLAGADLAGGRHDPRGRPDRGGGAHRRPRAGAGRDARRRSGRRPPERRGAAAAARWSTCCAAPACRRRRRSRCGTWACPTGCGSARDDPRRALVELHEPDERRLGGDAHAGLPGAPALGAAQPGDVRAAGGALRDRARVPARRRRAARPAARVSPASWPARGPGSSRRRASSRRWSRRRASSRPSSGRRTSRSCTPAGRPPWPTGSWASCTRSWPRRSAWTAARRCSSSGSTACAARRPRRCSTAT